MYNRKVRLSSKFINWIELVNSLIEDNFILDLSNEEIVSIAKEEFHKRFDNRKYVKYSYYIAHIWWFYKDYLDYYVRYYTIEHLLDILILKYFLRFI